MSNNNKAVGTYYEQLFIAEALGRGLDVCHTVGDNLPFDVMVVRGPVQYRVQIKGTAGCGTERNGDAKYQWVSGFGQSKAFNQAYDMFAGYARYDNGDAWYIIPRRHIRYKTLKVFPHILNSKGKYEKFKDGWGNFLK